MDNISKQFLSDLRHRVYIANVKHHDSILVCVVEENFHMSVICIDDESESK